MYYKRLPFVLHRDFRPVQRFSQRENGAKWKKVIPLGSFSFIFITLTALSLDCNNRGTFGENFKTLYRVIH